MIFTNLYQEKAEKLASGKNEIISKFASRLTKKAKVNSMSWKNIQEKFVNRSRDFFLSFENRQLFVGKSRDIQSFTGEIYENSSADDVCVGDGDIKYVYQPRKKT